MKPGQAASAHIYIDLRWMIPGYTGGIEIMARNFLNELIKMDAVNQYTVLLPSVTRYDFDLTGRANFHLVTCDGPGYYFAKAWYLLRLWWARISRQPLPGYWIHARRTSAKTALSISGYIEPDLYPLKNVVVVHDLQHEYFPEFFNDKELAGRRKSLRSSLEKADAIVTVSEFTRQTLIHRMGVDPANIHLAYEGVSPIFHPGSALNQAKRSNDPDRDVLAKYQLQADQYLFYPANTWHHKNHGLLLDALIILKQSYGLSPVIVCTGTPKEAHAAILEKVKQYQLDKQLKFLGYCPYDELPALYRGASMLVYPSLFEGFGLPILEAMACGCPVVCSNATSLPEVAGEAARYFDPNDANACAEAIKSVLTDRELRNSMIQAGYAQASRYNWHNYARVIRDTLLEVNGLEAAAPITQPATQQAKASISRASRSRQAISLSQECFTRGKPMHGIMKFLQASFLAPEVVFTTLTFPWFRDHFLRRLLAWIERHFTRQ